MPEQKPKRLYHSEQVKEVEDKYLLQRRKKLFGFTSKEELDNTRFGIALSGGGIRSATINLGFLKTLNQFNILKRADYLSSVSGGGYTAAYIQAILKKEKDLNQLFRDDHIDRMRERGEYLMPGKGWRKHWNRLVLITGYLISLLMSSISAIILILIAYTFYVIIGKGFEIAGIDQVSNFLGQVKFLNFGLIGLVAIIAVHFIFNIFKKFDIKISRGFNQVETTLIIIGLIWSLVIFIINLEEKEFYFTGTAWDNIILILALFILGYLANPNALSFHRFYRSQLADAFLFHAHDLKNIRLQDMIPDSNAPENEHLAPYPLINTCLNLFASKDPKFKGQKAIDYFLLSPLYSGAKLSNYVPTGDTLDYKDMTLPAAITISAAAVNPGMGVYSNKFLSIVMTILNARLGYWINNPAQDHSQFPVWWPKYFINELTSQMGTQNKKLNISDGGHIENLGVFELLRRKCRLILSVDAGADPEYNFSDLENLTIRARNELGLSIEFRKGQSPEEVIRPKPSHGYSEKRFAIADIIVLWEEIKPHNEAGENIKDKNGREIEILVNYKKLIHDIRRLDDDSLMTLNFCLDDLRPGNIGKMYEENQQTLDPRIQFIYDRICSTFEESRILMNLQEQNGLINEEQKNKVLQFVINTIRKRVRLKLKSGTFVYIKSSVTAPQSKLRIRDKESFEYKTYKYKIFHPDFPHEPTSDQFFDPVQWESYYRLGQFIGADVLNVEGLNDYFEQKEVAPHFSVEDLLNWFNKEEQLFKKEPEIYIPEPPLSEPAMRMPEEVVMSAPPASSMEAPETVEEEAPVQEQKPPEKKIVLGGTEDYSM